MMPFWAQSQREGKYAHSKVDAQIPKIWIIVMNLAELRNPPDGPLGTVTHTLESPTFGQMLQHLMEMKW